MLLFEEIRAITSLKAVIGSLETDCSMRKGESVGFLDLFAENGNLSFVRFVLDLQDEVLSGKISLEDARQIADMEGGSTMVSFFEKNLEIAKRAKGL